MAPQERHDALDGLRAVAVALVVAYHLDVPGLGGGFVGVDVFFVVSGYLITTLLLAQHARDGDLGVGEFLRRRARRLWPLAWSVLALVAVGGALGVWDPGQRRALPVETAAALAQVANWQQAVGGGYVRDLVAPSPLRHFWSLSIEEQFYLLWPLVLLGTFRAARRRSTDGIRTLAAVLGALAAISVASGFVTDASWAYLSTVTRMVALVAGAALAVAWRTHPLRGPTSGRRAVALLGAVGAAALLAVAVTGRPEDEWLRHGGFAAIAVAAVAVVAAVVAGFGGRVLAGGAVVWAGRRSYAVYLVHWPLIVALGPGRPLWLRVLVIVPSTLALADLAHRWIEEPVRRRRWRTVTVALAAPLVLTVTTGALWAGTPRTPTPEQEVASTLDRVADGVDGPAPPDSRTTTPAAASGASPAAPGCALPAPRPRTYGSTGLFDPSTVDAVADPDRQVCGDTRKVLVVGDSMARGLANGLVDVGDPRLRLWDRSELGCSFEGPGCPDWRRWWKEAVTAVDPDVVVLHTNVQPGLRDLRGVDFLSSEGHDRRVSLFAEAYRLLASTGARVLVDLPTTPLPPRGLFYCQGRATASACDDRYVAAWSDSMRAAAARTGAELVDVPAWAASRTRTFRSDRPDGVHFVGPALVALARRVADLAAG